MGIFTTKPILSHIYLLVFGVLFLVLGGCSQKSSTYFASVTINDDLTFKFEQPLDDDRDLKFRSRYEVKRDSLNRIVLLNKIKSVRRDAIKFFLGIPTVRVDYEGEYEKWSYFDKDGLPTKEKDFYSIRILREPSTRIVSWFGYNKCNKLIEDKSGVCQYKRLLDKNGRKLEELRFDRLGNRIEDNEGVYTLRFKYDDNGNLIELSNYDTSNNLHNRKSGYATIRYKYNSRGNDLEEAYFDSWGTPVSGPWCSCLRRTSYDDRSNRIEISYYDVQGKLMSCWGTAIQRWRWDKDKMVGSWQFDKDSNLIEGTLHKYDDKGQKFESRYIGADSQLVIDQLTNVAIIKYKYDSFGNEIEQSQYGIDDLPTRNSSGFFIEESKYDDDGRVVERSFRDVDSQLIEDSEGVAKYRFKYWQDSLRYEKRMFYGADDQLKSDSRFRVAVMQFTYDSVGNLIEDRYFGTDERPTLREDRGAAIVKFRYDSNRRLIEQSYYDSEERLIERFDLGYAILRQKWNDCGYVSEKSFLNKDRRLVEDSVGNAVYKFEYDDFGNTARFEYYDDGGNLHEDSSGFAIYTFDWDEKGRRIKFQSFGADGKLKEDEVGVAVLLSEYLDDEGAEKVSWRDKNGRDKRFGKVYSQTTVKDSSGNILRLENQNKRGNLTTDSTLVARYDFKYDSLGRQIEEAYYDTSNKLTLNGFGYAFVKREYNSQGKLVELKYLDRDRKLVEHKAIQCAVIRYEYDDAGILTKTIAFDRNRKIVAEWEE